MISLRRELPHHRQRLDPARVDQAVALVLLGAMEIDVWTTAHGPARLVQSTAAVALAAAVAVRRRWLLRALPAVVVASVVAHIAAGAHGPNGLGGVPGSLAGLLLFYAGGAFLDGPRSWWALLLGMSVTSVSAIAGGTEVAANLVWNDAIVAVLPWVIGRGMRERSKRERALLERAERIDAEHEAHVRAAALGERARLAREIHDVIAHSVSVMVIQAAGARTVMDHEPERAEASLKSVERAGREALAEMRRLLGVLGDAGDLRALAPQPGLEDLDDLVSRTRAAGLDASLRVEGEPVAVSPGLGLCVYRVVQEALTNTIKHAGSARAEVLLRWCGRTIELEVIDDGADLTGTGAVRDQSGFGAVSGGHGISGMRERAALHGGTVQAGPAPSGGFAIRAQIPLLGRQAA